MDLQDNQSAKKEQLPPVKMLETGEDRDFLHKQFAGMGILKGEEKEEKKQEKKEEAKPKAKKSEDEYEFDEFVIPQSTNNESANGLGQEPLTREL